MKNRRSIFLFWALFLVPTLLMAGVAFVLLEKEQERITLSAIHALSQQAQSVSETIHLTIETVQENLEQSMLEIDSLTLKTELVQWEATNPLVRNIFIYYPKKQLEYPVKGMASTFEERMFMNRYDSLFSGRIKFDENQMSLRVSDQESNRQAEELPQSSRKKLIALSRLAKQEKMVVQEAMNTAGTDQKYIGQKGWIPWFSENHLFLLGWVQPYENSPIYGIELELMTLLSRLVVDFPRLLTKGATMVLMDGNHNAMHQSGRQVDVAKEKPVAIVPVSPLLPHWQVAVFVDKNTFQTGHGFLYVSILLLGIFIAAIVSGGTLLTRLTLSNIKDAQQKTSFVSSVSHELKTPLTSIRMYAELLLSKRVKDPQKIQTYLSVIVNESQRLTRLINNVLDFSKLEQGKKKYQLIHVDIADLLAQIIEDHSIRIQENKLEIIMDIKPGEYMIKTDRDAVDQVVLNLLDNALKYAGSGQFIKFVLTRNKAFVDLKICDDGPGIPKAQQALIFNKFYRGDDSLTAKQPGSGLGLSIARQILKDLNGDLIFEPMPENGSCFTARIKDME